MPGTRVRFTTDQLCLIGRSELVYDGDTGTVIGPGPDERWIYVEPDKYPESVCPVAAGMIEALA